MGRSLFIFIWAVALPTFLFGQQLPLFTQYREHIGIINPAAAAAGYLLYGQTGTIGTSVRQQWAGKEGAPQTQLIQGSYLWERSGYNVSPIFGGHLINDKVGRVATTGVYGRLGGALAKEPAYGGIAVGLTLGMVQYRVDLNGVIARDAGDELLENPDLNTRVYPDAGVGVYVWKQLGKKEDYLVGGFSIPQILGLDVTFRNTDNKSFNLNRVRHFYGNVGWIHHLSRSGSLIELNAWVKYVPNAPFHFDVNSRYQIGEQFWLGLGAGTSKAVHLETGVLLFDSRFKLGYGYDFNLSDKILAFGHSHEINLSYAFGTSNVW